MSRWAAVLSTGLALAAQLWAPVAAAQDDLATAERLLENAEFERAADLLESIAESDRGLDRAGVAELLRLRAVVRSALGRDRDASRDLASLARVLEGREPGALPDPLRRELERHRRGARPIEASVRIQPEPGGPVLVRLETEGDPSGLVRRTELVCTSGGREVASTDSDRLSVTGERELECAAALFGPGGWRAAEASARWRGADAGGEAPSWLDENWGYLAIGAGAAVALVVLISVVVYATAPTGVSGPVWVMDP